MGQKIESWSNHITSLIHTIRRWPSQCRGLENYTFCSGCPRPVQCRAQRSQVQNLNVLICRMGSQHNLTSGSMCRCALRGTPGLSSHKFGCSIAGSPLQSPLPLESLQAEAGRWKTDRKTRQLYKHPQAALM